jgi:hypothetical protein
MMRPQHRPGGKDLDQMIANRSALLTNNKDAIHHHTISNGTREVIHYTCRSVMYISNAQLYVVEICT